MLRSDQIIHVGDTRRILRAGCSMLLIGIGFMLMMFVLTNPFACGGVASGKYGPVLAVSAVLLSLPVIFTGCKAIYCYAMVTAYFSSTGTLQTTFEEVKQWKSRRRRQACAKAKQNYIPVMISCFHRRRISKKKEDRRRKETIETSNHDD